MFAAAILLTFITASPPAHHPVHKAPADLLARIAKSNPASLAFDAPPTRPLKTNGLRITPATHGADPTGTQDSWAALTACIAQCVNQSKNSPNGFFPGQDTSPTFGPIRDAGGCWVDLDGGEYRISKPLMLPEMVANMQFGGGSIVASPDFDAGKDPAFLFVIGVQGSCKVPQGSYVSFSALCLSVCLLCDLSLSRSPCSACRVDPDTPHPLSFLTSCSRLAHPSIHPRISSQLQHRHQFS